ncbi:Initiator Rep protein [Corchorus olitorius]|uniref:Initiator Rep protein n=1 Tax=Corchorus olitorius TaxID=93759 RepID=A0A1R3L185_9ROSI|nr:Initiator Rep protein [Corchorus olitorius]
MFHANALNAAVLNLTRDQRRVIYQCQLQINSKGWPENGVFTFTRQKYAADYGVGEDEAGRDLKKAINGFRGKFILLEQRIDELDASGELEIDWTTSRWKCDEKGVYALKLNVDLKPLFTPAAADLLFTITQFDDARKLSSKWSQLLYDLLCQFRESGWCKVRLDDLRIRWNTPPSYDKWALFRSRILEPSIDELKRTSEFKNISYELGYEGQAVSTLLFHFDSTRKMLKDMK